MRRDGKLIKWYTQVGLLAAGASRQVSLAICPNLLSTLILFSWLWTPSDGPQLRRLLRRGRFEYVTHFFFLFWIVSCSIDSLTIPSRCGKGELRRISEVFDCWFESGSMPYAQAHYPFENRKEFEDTFPADFIAEGIDQTRGW